ncbi:MAG: NHLP bacteriocin export ABC transporter permease/ATPase subunit [Bdellovibrionales bacterium]|nr:NHLP bacteriocin export ABC transporter permease/ATPase subunit [Bdellovibrionales bacterium]
MQTEVTTQELAHFSQLSAVTRAFQVGGRESFLLDDPGVAYLIASGTIDLFSTVIRDGIPVGPRTPLFRCHAGQGVLGVGTLTDAHLGLVAVPGPATILLPMPYKALATNGCDDVVEQWKETLEAHCLGDDAIPNGLDHDVDGESLDEFHQRMLRALHERRMLEQQVEAERLDQRSALREQVFAQALGGVSQVLEQQAGRIAVDAELSHDALFATCKLIGEHLNLSFAPHPDAHSGKVLDDPLGGILNASKIRQRQIVLRGAWWNDDAGPLLGWRKSDGHPLALIPERPGRYLAIDATTGTSERVTREVAETIASLASMFYRPFPNKPLNALDLLRHGVFKSTRDLAAVLFMGCLGGVLAALTPYLTGLIFDAIIPGAQYGQLLTITIILVVAAFINALFGITRSMAMLRIEGRMAASVQCAIWDRVLGLPAPFFRDYSAGNLARRAYSIERIREVLSGAVMNSLLGGVFSIFYVMLLFSYSIKLALWASGLVLIALAMTFGISLCQLRYERQIQNIAVRLSGRVFQFLTGIAKLRVAGIESQAFSLWANEFAVQRKLQFRSTTLANILDTFFEVFPLVANIIIFYQVAMLSGNGALSTGAFLGFLAAFTAFFSVMLQMGDSISALWMTLPFYENAKPILKTCPESSAAKSDPGKLRGEIELNQVDFRYTTDGPQILKSVSLQIKPGEFVAFVGPSGSGKSTIFRLLLGFETPEAGSIYFDGQDLAGLDLSAVRRQIGVVLQNGKLMPGDVFTNIVGSSTTLTLDDAWEAARMAGLADDLEQMPMGMHTVVSEGGSTLSGGQRQRLMIARAIVKRPNILLMDEATSALDNRTQEIVSRSLEALDATRIVIAHRLSTIIGADKIVVVEAGVIREMGTYAELMERNGIFAELAKRQIA